MLIGHYQPPAYVGFYTLPSRILQYAGDAVSRVGGVTRSSAAELSAMGRKEAVWKLGVYSNRYSLTLFMPLVIVLLLYGRDLILRWVGPLFALNSAPLLPVFLISTSLVLADDQKLQQVREPPVAHILVDDPEYDGGKDDGDEHMNQDQKHHDLA